MADHMNLEDQSRSPEFYLTLHGETQWNRERRFQGQLDSPLTDRGVQQAYLMGATLRELLGDSSGWSVVSSPLRRAQRTAEIICQVLGISSRQIETDARLAEINLGSWAGLTRNEVEARWPGALDDTGRYDWYFRFPDGETLQRSYGARQPMALRYRPSRPHCRRLARRNKPHPAGTVWRNRELGRTDTQGLRDVVFRLHDGSVDRIPCQ